jgi:hypothetical protein
LKTNDKGMAAATPLELINPVATEKGWMFHLKKLDGTISMGSYNRVTVFIDSVQKAWKYLGIPHWGF